MEHSFWMVCGVGQGEPKFRHNDRSAAEAEAKRLARIQGGVDFIVLHAVSIARRVDVALVELDASDTPF